MGIKNLNTLLRENCQSANLWYPLSTWGGKRFAIDAINWAYGSLAVANKEVVNKTDVILTEPDHQQIVQNWLTGLWRFLRRFLIAGITPVFVFDGKPGEEKSATRDKRRNDRNRIRTTLEELQVRLSQMDPLFHTIDMIEKVRTLRRQLIPIGYQEIEILKTILYGIGIPYLQAIGEADGLCSALCREGLVSAVYSRDTDMLAHQCPVLITEFVGRIHNPYTNLQEEHVKTHVLGGILKELDFTPAQFIDLCIMSGCDYNENISGIGVKKAFNLLKQYGSIDHLPIKYDRNCLNYSVCRDIFYSKSHQTLCTTPIPSLDINRGALNEYGRQYLENYGVASWSEELVQIILRDSLI